MRTLIIFDKNNPPKFEDMINQVICGDCLEVMKYIPDESVDLLLTDPPYNIGDANKRTKQGDRIVSNKEAWGEWDNYDKVEYDKMICLCLGQMFRILRSGGSLYMFTARVDNGFFIRKAIEEGFVYRNQIAIIKDNPLPHFCKNNWRSAFELCFYVSKGKVKTFNFLSQQDCVNVFHYLIGKKDTSHPTEKPDQIFKKIVQVSSNKGDVVLDCFNGSGTSCLSAKAFNRNFIGIEINKKYCEIAERRLAQEYLF